MASIFVMSDLIKTLLLQAERYTPFILHTTYFTSASGSQTIRHFPKMIPNGCLIFEDDSFLDSTVAKMNALRKSGQFCDVRLQVALMLAWTLLCFLNFSKTELD